MTANLQTADTIVASAGEINTGADTPLDKALKLAKRYDVFPLHRKDLPCFAGWPEKATRDEATIRSWWTQYPDALVGIHCAGLAVADIDVKDGAKGQESFDTIQEHDTDFFPDTCQQRTKSGGFHLVYSAPHRVSNTIGRIAPGIDSRGERGYILVHDVDALLSGEIEPAPQWLLDKLHKVEVEARSAGVEEVNQDVAKARALTYLADWASDKNFGEPKPRAKFFDSEANTYRIAAELLDLGLNEETAVELLEAHWLEFCDGGEDKPGHIPVTVKNAARYKTNKGPVNSVEALFGALMDEELAANSTAGEPTTTDVTDGVAKTEGTKDPKFKPNLARFASPEEDYEPPETLVGALIPQHGLVALAALPGRSKSETAAGLAYAVASGAPDYLGREIAKGDHLVVYLDLERYLTTMQRLSAYAVHDVRGERRIAEVPLKMVRAPFSLTRSDDVHQLIADLNGLAAAMKRPVSLIVIDSLGAALGGQDTNTAAVGSIAGVALRLIRDQTGAAILCVCHTPKQGTETVSGSVQLDAVFDIEAFMRSEGEGQTGEIFVKKDNVLALEEHERHTGWQRETLQGKRSRVYRLVAGDPMEKDSKGAGTAKGAGRTHQPTRADKALAILQDHTRGGVPLPREDWIAAIEECVVSDNPKTRRDKAVEAVEKLLSRTPTVVKRTPGGNGGGYLAVGGGL